MSNRIPNTADPRDCIVETMFHVYPKNSRLCGNICNLALCRMAMASRRLSVQVVMGQTWQGNPKLRMAGKGGEENSAWTALAFCGMAR